MFKEDFSHTPNEYDNLGKELEKLRSEGKFYLPRASCKVLEKAFSIICGYSVSEYIRNRRLSLVAIEL